MPTKASLYDHTLELIEDYLGPAGERFLKRQITMHLSIEPDQLDKNNLKKLIKWLTLSFALLTSDEQDVEDFTHNLQTLVTKGHRKNAYGK